MELEFLVPVVVSGITAAGTITAAFLKVRQSDRAHSDRIQKLEEANAARISLIEKENAATKIKVDLFWKVVEKEMIGILHSPHTPDLDVLLDKLKNDIITPEEVRELFDRLQTFILTAETTKSSETIAAAILCASIEQRLISK